MSGITMSNADWLGAGTAGGMFGSLVNWFQASHEHGLETEAVALEQKAQSLIDVVTPPSRAGKASPLRTIETLPSQEAATASAKALRAEAQSVRASMRGQSGSGALVGLCRLALLPSMLVNAASLAQASLRNDQTGMVLHGMGLTGNALQMLSTHVANPRLVAGFGVTGALLSVAGPLLQDARHLP